MNVSELSGAELDAAVAQALGFKWRVQGRWCIAEDSGVPFRPSSVWADGGPIIYHEGIGLRAPDSVGDWGEWEAWMRGQISGERGPTPLIAAMRAFVVSKQEQTL